MIIVQQFKALKLTEMTEAYPLITAEFNAAKERRRHELETQIRALGFTAGDGKKLAKALAKYRSRKDASQTWAGRGVEPNWLRKEMRETGQGREHFKV